MNSVRLAEFDKALLWEIRVQLYLIDDRMDSSRGNESF